jgi:DNA invertase Pin-like site-specific DNA recombinase
LATPKPKLLMTTANTARAERMLNGGATQAEVASALGVSLTTLKRALGEK